MYRVLLADDEEEIRTGIQHQIDWERQGFFLVGTAENGQEAYDMAEKLKPDVVMTDIRMPYMSGIELGQKLCQILPNVKIVFFSGFDDFEYAKQAIAINAFDYILKPVNAEELSSLLEKLKQQLDEEYADKKDVERLRRSYEESLPILRDQLMIRLVEGKISEKHAVSRAEQYHLNLGTGYRVIAAVQADIPAEEEYHGGFSLADQAELIPLSLMNILQESMEGKFSIHSFMYDHLVVMVNLPNKEALSDLIEQMDRFCLIVKKYLSLSVCVGIGNAYEKIGELSKSYNGAKEALDYRRLIGHHAIFIDDIEPGAFDQFDISEQDLDRLSYVVKFEEQEVIRKRVDAIAEQFETAQSLTKCQACMTEILAELLQIVRTYQFSAVDVFGEQFKGYIFIEDYESLQEWKKWLYTACIKINQLIRHERIKSTNLLVEQAKTCVKERFSDSELSVEGLCQTLHVSSSYFSTVFKKETGEAFITYLTRVRMEEAVNLLNTTDDKTYMIAQKVGYTEPNYFSYVFKKQYGVSPTKYRSKG